MSRREKTIGLASALCGYDLWRLDRLADLYGSRKAALRCVVGNYFEGRALSAADREALGIDLEAWLSSPEFAALGVARRRRERQRRHPHLRLLPGGEE